MAKVNGRPTNKQTKLIEAPFNPNLMPIAETDTGALDPKSEATKKKYYDIYRCFVSEMLTVQELASKFKVNYEHCSRIVSWAAKQLEEGSKNVAACRFFVDSLREDIKAIIKRKEQHQNKKDTFIWLKLCAEERYLKKLIAQAEGVLSNADENKDHKIVVVFGDMKQKPTTIDGQAETVVEPE